MTHVSIIGTGNMGQAIASVVTRGGHTVELIGETDTDKAVTGDIVILAVPFPAISDVLTARGASLAGRIVVDITNPVDFTTFDSLTVPADSSGAAGIASALPDSRVLKAFNTTFAGTLASGSVGDNTTTVLVAGDDAEAKSTLIDAISSAGLNAVDVGSLARARELEAFGFLQISLAAANKTSWAAGFALVG